jgi:hypothetical protein
MIAMFTDSASRSTGSARRIATSASVDWFQAMTTLRPCVAVRPDSGTISTGAMPSNSAASTTASASAALSRP